ncbi:hypothetical protein Pst134EB_008757 [Puccinia striiformis f. sp. tritici]|uniref:Proteasome activator PA28 C-terminal domain-containing protein n=1 Tax=Puccinia striiformis f. sp. tritici PST-78 TaxID=1165861 RepID=A0A0L0URQ3_9BASI|nr:hypothetical protein Pst134EB_008757 [Puccinia striiformis f. sp. tritici]KNE89758.1 hypothetical protein PSTG_16791 [Puccinia striiformis f. sp. tritici PST-78]
MTTTNALWSETTDKGVQTQLKSWAQDIEQKGKEAIHAQLPAKILEINQILETFSDSTLGQLIVPSEPTTISSPTDQPESNSGRKKRKVANGKEAQPSVTDQAVPGGVKNPTHVSSNPRVNAHYIFLRTHWEELIDITNAIKIHINLLVPKIEDGDTFGVQVQEECLSELSRAQDSGYNLLEAQLKHNMSRAKLASKLIKYPNVEDYQIALQEHDRKSIFLCRQHLLDLRNIYALLTDLLHKNIVKITKPKGANSDGMY